MTNLAKYLAVPFALAIATLGTAAHATPSAHDLEYRSRLGLPAAWVACDTDKDCTLADLGCGKHLSVNKAHKEDLSQLAQQNLRNVCYNAAPDYAAAICDSGTCSTFAKDYK